MRITLSIIIFITLTVSAKGQINGLKTKLIDESYAWNKVSGEVFDNYYFNLQPLQTSKFQSHIRISLTGQIIDFYSIDNKNYLGKLTNYITEYKTLKDKNNDYPQNQEYQYIIEQSNLDEILVNKMVEKLYTTGQPKIPTDSLIASWQHNFRHCNSLIFQFKINGNYTKQFFHCPWGQKDSSEFKNIIVDNYEALNSIFRLDSSYKIFESKLTKGKSYTRDGYRMIYKMTDSQFENWNKDKPIRDYLKSLKDSIDNYINTEFKTKNIELKGIDCFEDFRLIFGINGKLVSVSSISNIKLKNSNGLKEYLAEKREVRDCRMKINELFKTIDLSFLNLKYEVYRIFTFNHKGEYQLRDDTMY